MSDETKRLDLDAIEARANAATMWAPDECDVRVDPEDGYVYAPQGATLGDTLIQLADTYEDSGHDWAFLAHARTDVPALVAEVRRLTRERNKAWRALRDESTARQALSRAIGSMPFSVSDVVTEEECEALDRCTDEDHAAVLRAAQETP